MDWFIITTETPANANDQVYRIVVHRPDVITPEGFKGRDTRELDTMLKDLYERITKKWRFMQDKDELIDRYSRMLDPNSTDYDAEFARKMQDHWRKFSI